MGKKIQCIGRYIMDGVVLGKGNFAHVELATHGVTKVKVAIKIIDTRKIKDEYVRGNLHREARIMTAIHHPNIVRLYETLKATTLYCLVTEYASGGDLLTYIKTQKDCRLPEGAARPFIRQLVSAIHYLHERNIVHRDLKMENIMLEEKQKNIKLIDFGLSNIYREVERLRTHCGSPEYAAPELFVVGRTYGPEIDIWSLGIITYAIVLGRLPFFTPYHDEYHRQRMLQQIQKGLCTIHDREMHTLSADCRNLLHQLVEPNPELRIPLPEIELHQWLTKNGKHPFSPYVTPMRNRNLRSQIVAELADLMDMKRGVVNETVKETRADELSAMFNMMMDQKKKELGLLDYDRSRRVLHNPSVSGASGSVEASGAHRVHKVLDGSRLRAPIQRPVQPRCKRDVTPRSRSESKRGGVLPPTSKPMGGATSRNRKKPSRPGPAPSTPINALVSRSATLLPSKDHPLSGPMDLAPANGPQPNGPSRIPVAPLMRARTAKLSLTLDLSVTNPGEATRRSQAEQDQLLARRRQAVSDCSYGIAASSGVPPQMSPNDPKEIGATSGSVKVKHMPQKTRVPSTPRKARRPSSLQYCLRQKPPKLTVHQEAPESSAIVSEAQPVPTSPRKLLAPKATPEDSLIDSCCSSTSEEQPLVTDLLEDLERSPGLIRKNSNETDWESQLRLAAAQDVVRPSDWAASSRLPARVSSGGDPRDVIERRFEQVSTESAKDEVSNEGGSERGANQSPHGDSNAGTNPSSHLCTDSWLARQLRRLTLSEQLTRYPWDRTLCRGRGSGISLPGDAKLRHASIGDTGDLDKLSTVSLCPKSQASETNTLVADPCSAKQSQTLSTSDDSSGSRLSGTTASAAKPSRQATGHCHSPGSPSCHWSHSRFSHIGSHALDVFFSPEETNSPTETLWRPVATTLRGSPTERHSSSSDPFEGDLLGDALAEGNPLADLAPLLNLLDVFADDDDLEDCGNTTVKNDPILSAGTVSPTRSPLNAPILDVQSDVVPEAKRPVKASEKSGSTVNSSHRKTGFVDHQLGAPDDYPQGNFTDHQHEGFLNQPLEGSVDRPSECSAEHPKGCDAFDRSCIEQKTDRRFHSGSQQIDSDHQRRYSGDRPGCNMENYTATFRPTADIAVHSDSGNGGSMAVVSMATPRSQESRVVGMATRGRIPVLSNLLRDRRIKRETSDGLAKKTAMTMMKKTPKMMMDDYPVEIGTQNSSGSSRVPVWRQGLSRLFQMSRTMPTTSDRNSNSICHSLGTTPFSGNSYKSKMQVANKTDPATNSNETVPIRANHRRQNDGGGTSSDYAMPPADSSDCDAAPVASVRANHCRWNVEDKASHKDARATPANSVEWVESDATHANSVRTNHCRNFKEGGDNNGNAAVPHVDWSGTEATKVLQQETSISSSGSVRISRSSRKRSSSRLQGRRINCDQYTADDESSATDNMHLGKVLPTSFRSASTSNRDTSKHFSKARKT